MAEEKKVNGINRLLEIGYDEILAKTHIEIEYVNALLNRDFDKLKGKNVRAFIKILEREYSVDLGELLDEYNIYAGDLEDDKKSLMSSLNSPLPDISHYEKKSAWYIWVIILVIAIWAVFYFRLYEITDKFPNLFGDKNITSVSSNATVIKNVETILEGVGVEIPKFDENNTIISYDEDKTNSELYSELNASATNALDKVIMLENIGDKNSSLDNNKSLGLTPQEPKFSIIPKANLWLGMIDMKTGKKSTLTTDKPIEIDLNSETLILTGHGLIDTNSSGEISEFKNRNPLRFHIKDGAINEISYDEFLKLNHGKAW
ncbi:MAG: hypothetical protein MR902_08375 [Campylobacter sp.]|nr:hypothetical protein [Campylobacter sp.]